MERCKVLNQAIKARLRNTQVSSEYGGQTLPEDVCKLYQEMLLVSEPLITPSNSSSTLTGGVNGTPQQTPLVPVMVSGVLSNPNSSPTRTESGNSIRTNSSMHSNNNQLDLHGLVSSPVHNNSVSVSVSATPQQHFVSNAKEPTSSHTKQGLSYGLTSVHMTYFTTRSTFWLAVMLLVADIVTVLMRHLYNEDVAVSKKTNVSPLFALLCVVRGLAVVHAALVARAVGRKAILIHVTDSLLALFSGLLLVPDVVTTIDTYAPQYVIPSTRLVFLVAVWYYIQHRVLFFISWHKQTTFKTPIQRLVVLMSLVKIFPTLESTSLIDSCLELLNRYDNIYADSFLSSSIIERATGGSGGADEEVTDFIQSNYSRTMSAIDRRPTIMVPSSSTLNSNMVRDRSNESSPVIQTPHTTVGFEGFKSLLDLQNSTNGGVPNPGAGFSGSSSRRSTNERLTPTLGGGDTSNPTATTTNPGILRTSSNAQSGNRSATVTPNTTIGAPGGGGLPGVLPTAMEDSLPYEEFDDDNMRRRSTLESAEPPHMRRKIHTVIAIDSTWPPMIRRNDPVPTFRIIEDTAALKDWDFNVFCWDPSNVLLTVCASIFPACEIDVVCQDTFHRFIYGISTGYGATPYHNQTHAADVVQSTYSMLELSGVWPRLSPLERLAVLVACAVHDVGHPGRNNTFMINTFDDIAFEFNDKSVLENYHCRSAFALMRSKEAVDITSRMDNEVYRLFRRMVVSLVLSTDMADHMSLLTTFRQKKFDVSSAMATEDSKMLVLRTVLHAADVSNPAKKLSTYSEWAKRVMDEFASQGTDENRLGLSYSPFCDPGANVAKCQMGFIQFVVKPLFEALHEFVDGPFAPMLKNLEDNFKHWEKKV